MPVRTAHVCINGTPRRGRPATAMRTMVKATRPSPRPSGSPTLLWNHVMLRKRGSVGRQDLVLDRGAGRRQLRPQPELAIRL